ncbi:MAG TPA: amino acid ABC transporter substrate-binding protein [Burkholderiaceae bacterium]|jgi:glutamate/aspartate transport system substrate-binding protein
MTKKNFAPGRLLPRARQQLWICALLMSAACINAVAQAPSPALERIKARGSIVVAHRESSIPLSYVADGKPMGYSLDVCSKIAEAIGRHLKRPDLKVSYLQVTAANRFDALEKGTADLECGSTTNTAARRERVAFTIPHFIASSRIVVMSSKPYERIEDLDGKVVASTLGTTSIDALAREAHLKTLNIKVAPAKDHAEGFGWVLAGKVEGFAMDDVLLFGLRANAPRPQDLKVIGRPITIEPYAIAFGRNDPTLKLLVDAELRRLIESKELHPLYDKWFNSPIPPLGINLEMRMPHLLVDSFKYPSDFVPG